MSNFCPDCKGTGIYQGLFKREDCKACGGAGKVADKNKQTAQSKRSGGWVLNTGDLDGEQLIIERDEEDEWIVSTDSKRYFETYYSKVLNQNHLNRLVDSMQNGYIFYTDGRWFWPNSLSYLLTPPYNKVIIYESL